MPVPRTLVEAQHDAAWLTTEEFLAALDEDDDVQHIFVGLKG